jgi:hypothetical protein
LEESFVNKYEETPVIRAQTSIAVSLNEARQWFLDLEKHPERYQFATHAGFRFVQGDFGEVGARFETQERFHGLRLTLRFELSDVEATSFRFRLLQPPLPIWGAFVIEPRDSDTGDQTDSIILYLDVGSTTRLGRRILNLPLVKDAIQRQTQAEVEHIKASLM